MRFGKWRGVSLAFAVAAVLGLGLASTVRADGWHLHPTLPGEVPAYDLHDRRRVLRPARAVRTLREGLRRWGRQGAWGSFAGCSTARLPRPGMATVAARAAAWDTVTGAGTAAMGAATAATAAASAPAAGCSTTVRRLGRLRDAASRSRRGGHCDGRWPAATATGTRRTSLPATRRPWWRPRRSSRLAQAASLHRPRGSAATRAAGSRGKHSHLGNLANKIRCRLCGGGGCGGCGGAGLGDPCSGCGGGRLRRLRRLRPVHSMATAERLRPLRRQGLCELPQGPGLQGPRPARRPGPAPPPEGRLLRGPRRPGAADPRLCPLHRYDPISARLLLVPADES